MFKPESIPITLSEAGPLPHISIAVDSALTDRFESIQFSREAFTSWAQERGAPENMTEPLHIAVRETSSDGREVRGGFWADNTSAYINLYVGHLLVAVDKFRDAFSYDVLEADLNDSLNGTLVHEVEHYFDYCRGERLLTAQQHLLFKELLEVSSRTSGTGELSEDQVEEAFTAYHAYDEEQVHQTYLALPYEVRAREASRAYRWGHNHMLSMTLRAIQ